MESVGQAPHAVNRPQYVMYIQYIFNLIYPYGPVGYIPEDGVCSYELINRIIRFQQFELKFSHPDGVISRDGKTFIELAKLALKTPRVQVQPVPTLLKPNSFDTRFSGSALSSYNNNDKTHQIVDDYLFNVQGFLMGMAFNSQELMASRINGATEVTEQDYINIANRLGNNIDYKLVEAFGMVESGGNTGFNDFGLPKIAYEGHIFRANTQGKYDKTHLDLSYRYPGMPAGPQWKINNHGQGKSWDTLKRAFELEPESALMSVSWGTFQIMGGNFDLCNYGNVFLFVDAMKQNAANHYDAFITYCEGRGLVAKLVSKDYNAIAATYNGKDNHGYGQKIKAAYESLMRKH